MESENVGVCKRSGSSRLDSPLHQRFFYGLSLQLVDTEKMLVPSLEIFNYLVAQIYFKRKNGCSGYTLLIRIHA